MHQFRAAICARILFDSLAAYLGRYGLYIHNQGANVSNLSSAVPFRVLAAGVLILGSVGACTPDAKKTSATTTTTPDSASALASAGMAPEFAVMERPVGQLLPSGTPTLCPEYVRQTVTGQGFVRAESHEVRQAMALGEPLVVTSARAAYIPSSPAKDGGVQNDTLHLDCRTLQRLPSGA